MELLFYCLPAVLLLFAMFAYDEVFLDGRFLRDLLQKLGVRK